MSFHSGSPHPRSHHSDLYLNSEQYVPADFHICCMFGFPLTSQPSSHRHLQSDTGHLRFLSLQLFRLQTARSAPSVLFLSPGPPIPPVLFPHPHHSPHSALSNLPRWNHSLSKPLPSARCPPSLHRPALSSQKNSTSSQTPFPLPGAVLSFSSYIFSPFCFQKFTELSSIFLSLFYQFRLVIQDSLHKMSFFDTRCKK